MSTPVRHAGPPRTIWVAIGIAASGCGCLLAGILVAYLIADHSSSDSSASSQVAIGLMLLGVAQIFCGFALGVAVTAGRLWRHRPQDGTHGSSLGPGQV